MKGLSRERTKFIAALAGLAAALSLVPSVARAQTWRGLELERRMREAAWHFGPFLIQPSLVIADAGVDSNVYYTPSDPIKDLTFTAGPAATIFIPVQRKFVLSLYGSPQYVWYSKTERERTWNHYFNGAAQLNLRNVFFSLDAAYSDARQRWSTEIDIRPRRKELGYGGSALVRVGWKTSFSVGYRTVSYDYESVEASGSDVRERLNRSERYANISLFYQTAAERRLFLEFEYGRYDFDFASQAAIGDAESGAAYGGLEFSQFGRRIQGRFRIGYKKHDVRNPDMPDYQGVVGDTRLSLRLARALAIRGSYVRDVRFSLWYAYSYFIETRPGAGISVYPLTFIRFDYDYSKGRNRYPELPGGGGIPRFDEFDIHSGGVYFRIIKNTAIGFVVNWWARDSNFEDEDDKRLFYGLNLTYDF